MLHVPTRARSKETITGAYNIGFTVFHLCNNDEIAYMKWFQGKELSPGTVYAIIHCTVPGKTKADTEFECFTFYYDMIVHIFSNV